MTVTENSASESSNAAIDQAALNTMADALAGHDIAVLGRTAKEVAKMADDPESADIQRLSEVVLSDPLMTLKVLATVSTLAKARQVSRPETVTGAVIWMGMEPFFEHFAQTASIDSRLIIDDESMQSIRAVVARSQYAARIAVALAEQRNDLDISVVHESALVHDIGELLMWQFEPQTMAMVRDKQRAARGANPQMVQAAVLGYTLSDLSCAVMQRWQMPRLMQRLINPAHVEDRQVRSVLLAVQLASHLQSGWSHPELVADLEAVAQLLCVSRSTARSVIERA